MDTLVGSSVIRLMSAGRLSYRFQSEKTTGHLFKHVLPNESLYVLQTAADPYGCLERI